MCFSSRPPAPVFVSQPKYVATKTVRKTPRNAVHVSVKNRVMVPVEFAQTGHPFLDTRPSNHAQEPPFACFVWDARDDGGSKDIFVVDNYSCFLYFFLHSGAS